MKILAAILTVISFFHHPLYSGTAWTTLNGPVGYSNPQTILFHQGALYVSSNVNGSNGTGIWKSSNNGNSWTEISTGLPKPYARDMEALGNLIFVACDTGVYSSNNQGASWNIADNSLPDFTSVYELAVHQGELFAGVYQGTGNVDLYKTANNGLSWTFTGYTFGFSSSLNQLYSHGSTLWAATSAGIYKSTDAGVTFQFAGNNIPFNASITSIAASGDTAYCGTTNGSYYTLNGGQLWNPVSIPSIPNPVYIYSWKIVGNLVYAGLNTNGVYVSPLGSSNAWNVFGSGYYSYNLPWMLSYTGTEIFAATSEGIYACPVGGGTWVSRDGNITRARTSIGWAEGNLILAGSGFYSGLKRTVNGGLNWNNTSINNQQGLYKKAIKVNNTLLMPSNYSMYRSVDNGQTWTSPVIAPIPNYDIATYGNYLIAASGNNIVFSADDGLSWNIFSSGLPTNGSIYSVGVNGQSAYAGVNNSVYKMEYPGAAWTNFSQGITGNGLIHAIETIGNTLVISNTFGIFRRTVEDSLWRQMLPPGPVRDMTYSRGYLFIATHDGVFFSDNLGKDFHPWNEGFPAYMGAVESLFADGPVLYAGTMEHSAWKRTIDPELRILSAGNVFCTGAAAGTITAQCTAPVNPGNKYYLQISDAIGRFLNPLTIDSISSTSGIVSFMPVLPNNISAGTGYRFRVVSSDPYYLSLDNGIDIEIMEEMAIVLQPANQTVCPGSSCAFYTGASGTITGYQWQADPNGSGNYTNLTNNAIYQGVNTATLLINNSSGLDGFRYRCQVIAPCLPSPGFTNYATLNVTTTGSSILDHPDSLTVCNGTAAAFSVTAGGTGITYQWQVDNGFGVYSNLSNGGQYTGVNTATLQLSFTNTAMDGYRYRCKVGNCEYSNSALLIVNGEPINTGILGQQYYCAGGEAQFAVSIAGSGISYQWEENSGGGFTVLQNGTNYSGVTTPVLRLTNIPSNFNNYLYRCVITGQCAPGQSITGNGELLLATAPVILNQATDISVCEGDTANFTTTATGSFLYYDWEINTGSGWNPVPEIFPYSGTHTPALNIEAVTSSMQNHHFRCRFSDCVTGDSAALTVLAAPQLTASNLVICSYHLPYPLQNAATPAGGTYFGNGIYNGIFNPYSVTAGLYFYDYYYLAANGCHASAGGTVRVEDCTGNPEPNGNISFLTIYPNPASDKVTIRFGEPVADVALLQIYTMTGCLLEEKQISQGMQDVPLNITGLEDGLYILSLHREEKREIARLVIIH